MAYSELIKNFGRIRDYMREFYVYGFKSRDEYTLKSARSYDDERRRLESWLGDYMGFRQTPDGKKVFLSIDSRICRHNPLYKAWKAKSFTDGDITLHFLLFDILCSPEISLTLNELTQKLDEYLEFFGGPRTFDVSTVRKKLKEYVSEGIIVAEKRGKTLCYRRAEGDLTFDPDALAFFSEVAPVGVVGSYLLDKQSPSPDRFAFKHHYITGALDSEIVCQLLDAVSSGRYITLGTVNRRKDRLSESRVVPLRIFISVQSGRHYLMAFAPRFRRITSYRIDNILSVKEDEVCPEFGELKQRLEEMEPHIWGVSTQGGSGERIEHVEFTVRYSPEEPFIHQRLEREKRCGKVERLSDTSSRFSADVYDATELVPWIRTFICRITDVSFSDKALERRFRQDILDMYALYGLGSEGGDGK
ncbi:MAG: WYL domain-containing protein [Clostridia bacterium]|nr:WYL domain-containing protein [Clostridia bacterium]